MPGSRSRASRKAAESSMRGSAQTTPFALPELSGRCFGASPTGFLFTRRRFEAAHHPWASWLRFLPAGWQDGPSPPAFRRTTQYPREAGRAASPFHWEARERSASRLSSPLRVASAGALTVLGPRLSHLDGFAGRSPNDGASTCAKLNPKEASCKVRGLTDSHASGLLKKRPRARSEPSMTRSMKLALRPVRTSVCPCLQRSYSHPADAKVFSGRNHENATKASPT